MATSRRDFAALEARRLQAARLFARGESQAAVAQQLGVTRVSAHHWYHAWKRRGRLGLKGAGRAGRKPKLSAAAVAVVEGALRAGPAAQGFRTDLWTLPRVAEVITRLTGVRHHPGHVWRILRRLGWSLQRPARRARERDEAAIARWKTRRWAQLKKRPPPPRVARLRRRKWPLAAARRPPDLGPPRRDPDLDARRGPLEAPVDRRGFGLPLGWAPQPLFLSDAAGDVQGRRADQLPATGQTPLPRAARPPHLGRLGRAQERPDAGVPRAPAPVADRRTAARLRAGVEPRRTGLGQSQRPGAGQRLRPGSADAACAAARRLPPLASPLDAPVQFSSSRRPEPSAVNVSIFSETH